VSPLALVKVAQLTDHFSILKLSPEQCRTLISDYHIYLPQSGRINISGLNSTNVEYVAKAIDSVVRAG